MNTRLREYLEEHDIKYTLHEHEPIFTVEEGKKIKQNIPGLGAKNLFLKDRDNKYYLICLPGEKRLDMDQLRSTLKIGKLFFASPMELEKELSVMPGSVSIFCLIHAKTTKLILDKELWDAEVVGFHPNINTETLELPHESLEKFYNSLSLEKEIVELK